VSRAERLLALLELLRAHRYPVPGAALAARLGVSLRTLYRDVAALQGLGARVAGEPGVGYVLRPGFTLPPLALTDDELDALLLGVRWVAGRGAAGGAAPLAEAARRAAAKIGAGLPSGRRAALDDAPLLVSGRSLCGNAAARPERGATDPADAEGAAAAHSEPPSVDQASIRAAIRREHKLVLTYQDPGGRLTTRTVWPVALAYFDRAQLLVAWCELRAGYRHFRPDRIRALAPTAERYPRPRHVLLAEWRSAEGVDGAAGDPLQRAPR
jgi:predicted DNA-binding transcriptional regulator YafY